MRPHHGVRALAAVLTATAITAPAAQADIDNFQASYTPAHSAPAPRPDGTDWTLVGLGTAGGIALIGAGVTGSRRVRRRQASVARIGTASGS
jgi:hypothetical protein